MKGPKTGLPGGTTFDPKRVHFWVPSQIYLLCARDQNWALSILNLVPPSGLVWRPTQILSWIVLFASATYSNVTDDIATARWQLGASNKRGPHCVSKKLPKMNPLDIARCCSESNRQISKCGKTSMYIAKFWSVQTCNFFSVGSRTYRISYSLQKLHGCTLIFLYLLFGSKNREIDQFACDLIRHNFSNMGTFPRTPCT